MGNNNNICQYGKREVKIVNMLHYINNQVWKTMFGKPGDGIEQSIEDDDEYRIIDSNPLTNKFTSAGQQDDSSKMRTKSMGGPGGDAAANLGPNCASFVAGIVEGMLNSAKLHCKCSAVFVPEEDEENAG